MTAEATPAEAAPAPTNPIEAAFAEVDAAAAEPGEQDDFDAADLGNIPEREEPEETTDGEEESSEGEEAPEEPAAAAPEEPDVEDWSDERPWTPERIKSAVAQAKDLTIKAHKMWGAAEKRAAKLERKVGEMKQQRAIDQAAREQLALDLRAIKTGDGATVLKTLARLAETTPHELYEEMSLSMARGGIPKEDPEKAAMRKELDDIKAKLEAQEQGEQKHQAAFAARRAVLHGVQDAQGFPSLAKYAEQVGKAEIAAELERGILLTYQRNGQSIDIGSATRQDVFAALSSAELYLRNHPELLQPGADGSREAAASGADAGRGPSAQAKPELAQSTPGKSVTPSLASSPGGARRAKTEQEINEELANDPGFFKALGLDL